MPTPQEYVLKVYARLQVGLRPVYSIGPCRVGVVSLATVPRVPATPRSFPRALRSGYRSFLYAGFQDIVDYKTGSGSSLLRSLMSDLVLLLLSFATPRDCRQSS